MRLTDLNTNKLSELIAATEAASLMPIAADIRDMVDDSCDVTVIVEEVDKSAIFLREKKLDNS